MKTNQTKNQAVPARAAVALIVAVGFPWLSGCATSGESAANDAKRERVYVDWLNPSTIALPPPVEGS